MLFLLLLIKKINLKHWLIKLFLSSTWCCVTHYIPLIKELGKGMTHQVIHFKHRRPVDFSLYFWSVRNIPHFNASFFLKMCLLSEYKSKLCFHTCFLCVICHSLFYSSSFSPQSCSEQFKETVYLKSNFCQWFIHIHIILTIKGATYPGENKHLRSCDEKQRKRRSHLLVSFWKGVVVNI